MQPIWHSAYYLGQQQQPGRLYFLSYIIQFVIKGTTVKLWDFKYL